MCLIIYSFLYLFADLFYICVLHQVVALGGTSQLFLAIFNHADNALLLEEAGVHLLISESMRIAYKIWFKSMG